MADIADMAVHGLHVACFFSLLFVVWITLFCFGVVAMGRLGIRNKLHVLCDVEQVVDG
jgi:hypothetical protein